jgi:hypothetical protein
VKEISALRNRKDKTMPRHASRAESLYGGGPGVLVFTGKKWYIEPVPKSGILEPPLLKRFSIRLSV